MAHSAALGAPATHAILPMTTRPQTANAQASPAAIAAATAAAIAAATAAAIAAAIAAAAQALAEQTRVALLADDHATRMLGMQIVSVTPGGAVIQMAVRQDMLNGHAICHGGLIATLADSTFAFACNSHNEVTVASGFSIDFLAPGRLGDVLTATCTEQSRTGRTGVYDTLVVNQRGERIALFRGRSYTMRGKPVVPV